VHLTRGPGGGCAPSPGSNGSADPLASPSCDAAASAGTWRPKPPAVHMALGGSRRAPRLPLLCQMPSSVHLAWPPSRHRDMHNLPNRRIRIRMYGGVGGEESRDSPLSRSQSHDPKPGSEPHRDNPRSEPSQANPRRSNEQYNLSLAENLLTML